MSELSDIRAKIDAIDNELLRLLNERAALALEVGRVKNREGLPIYAPEREDQLLRSLTERSEGPLRPKSIRAIYREIMSASLALEKDVVIGCYGSEGGRTHQAARLKFGSSVSYAFGDEVAEVFTAVAKGEADCGVVPIEDTEHGPVHQTLDQLALTDLTVCAEICVGEEETEAGTSLSRFLVLSRTGTPISGNDKTTLMLRIEDAPGALVSALEPFKDLQMNLSHFASRPAAKGSSDIFFFVEVDGHARVEAFAEVLRELSRRCRAVKILGSYPKASRN